MSRRAAVWPSQIRERGYSQVFFAKTIVFFKCPTIFCPGYARKPHIFRIFARRFIGTSYRYVSFCSSFSNGSLRRVIGPDRLGRNCITQRHFWLARPTERGRARGHEWIALLAVHEAQGPGAAMLVWRGRVARTRTSRRSFAWCCRCYRRRPCHPSRGTSLGRTRARGQWTCLVFRFDRTS